MEHRDRRLRNGASCEMDLHPRAQLGHGKRQRAETGAGDRPLDGEFVFEPLQAAADDADVLAENNCAICGVPFENDVRMASLHRDAHAERKHWCFICGKALANVEKTIRRHEKSESHVKHARSTRSRPFGDAPSTRVAQTEAARLASTVALQSEMLAGGAGGSDDGDEGGEIDDGFGVEGGFDDHEPMAPLDGAESGASNDAVAALPGALPGAIAAHVVASELIVELSDEDDADDDAESEELFLDRDSPPNDAADDNENAEAVENSSHRRLVMMSRFPQSTAGRAAQRERLLRMSTISANVPITAAGV
jgi:ribosomal protein L34E